MIFYEDVIAGALIAASAFFLALALGSYARSRVGKLVPVSVVLAVMLVKNVLVVLDALWGVLGGSLSGWLHFLADAALLSALVAVALVRRGEG